MRIGYLVPEFPAQTHIFFWREIQALERLGAEVFLLSTRTPRQATRHAFGPLAQQRTRYLFPPRYLASIVYLLARPRLLLMMVRYILGVEDTPLAHKVRLLALTLCAAELLRYAANVQLEHVHGHSCADVAHLLALASLSEQLPYSLTLHGDLVVYGTAHRSKFRRAKFVAVVTHALQHQVQTKVGLSLDKVPVIRMGVDVERFSAPQIRSGDDKELRLITVARLDDCKGHIFALQAMRIAMDQGLRMTYTIVGDGDYRPAIEAEVRRLGLESVVRLPGTASEDEVLAYLRASDTFVLPSVGLGEAAPVSVMEAMACGMSIVASIIGGTPELITDGVDGFLIAQRDTDGLAKAFICLGRDPSLRSRMGGQARSVAELHFSAQRFAAQLLKAMQKSQA